MKQERVRLVCDSQFLEMTRSSDYVNMGFGLLNRGNHKIIVGGLLMQSHVLTDCSQRPAGLMSVY